MTKRMVIRFEPKVYLNGKEMESEGGACVGEMKEEREEREVREEKRILEGGEELVKGEVKIVDATTLQGTASACLDIVSDYVVYLLRTLVDPSPNGSSGRVHIYRPVSSPVYFTKPIKKNYNSFSELECIKIYVQRQALARSQHSPLLANDNQKNANTREQSMRTVANSKNLPLHIKNMSGAMLESSFLRNRKSDEDRFCERIEKLSEGELRTFLTRISSIVSVSSSEDCDHCERDEEFNYGRSGSGEQFNETECEHEAIVRRKNPSSVDEILMCLDAADANERNTSRESFMETQTETETETDSRVERDGTTSGTDTANETVDILGARRYIVRKATPHFLYDSDGARRETATSESEVEGEEGEERDINERREKRDKREKKEKRGERRIVPRARIIRLEEREEKRGDEKREMRGEERREERRERIMISKKDEKKSKVWMELSSSTSSLQDEILFILANHQNLICEHSASKCANETHQKVKSLVSIFDEKKSPPPVSLGDISDRSQEKIRDIKNLTTSMNESFASIRRPKLLVASNFDENENLSTTVGDDTASRQFLRTSPTFSPLPSLNNSTVNPSPSLRTSSEHKTILPSPSSFVLKKNVASLTQKLLEQSQLLPQKFDLKSEHSSTNSLDSIRLLPMLK